MSIQFRSRIRTVADYGAFGLSDLGVCCNPETDAEPTCETYQSCMEGNGWWRGLPSESGESPCTSGDVVEGFTCPELSSRGCCCNCSLLNGDFQGFYDAYNENNNSNVDNGTQNMTYCECMDIGGNWTNLECDLVDDFGQLCQEDGQLTDIRFPSACCSDGICNDVCTPQDCVGLGDGQNILYENKVCADGPSTIDPDDYSCDFGEPELCFSFPGCGSGFNRSASSSAAQRHSEIRTEKTPSGDNMLIVSTSPTKEMHDSLLKSGSIKAACIETVGLNYTCTQKTKLECNGAWMGLNQDSTPVLCSDASSIEVIENIGKDYIPSSTVDGWSLGQQVFGNKYQGRFFGIFTPASRKESQGSMCYGKSIGIGKPEDYPATTLEDQVGIEKGNRREAEKRYAVIVDNKDYRYNLKFGNTNGKWSSRWDTITNKKLLKTSSLIDDINNKRKGWLIPSQDLQSFIVRQLKDTTLKTNLKTDTFNQWHHFKLDRYYWTSTVSVDGVYIQKVNSILTGHEEIRSCNYNEKHFTRLVYLKEIK
tara:strand:- start:608 stop:2212 length:1605 start_codon:yes stop_codon:yes gene_type:complete